jgi:hypothetical protein
MRGNEVVWGRVMWLRCWVSQPSEELLLLDPGRWFVPLGASSSPSLPTGCCMRQLGVYLLTFLYLTLNPEVLAGKNCLLKLESSELCI